MADRIVSFTYSADDDETADWFADYLRRLVTQPVNEPVEFTDLARLETGGIGDIAWSVERVVPETVPVRRRTPDGRADYLQERALRVLAVLAEVDSGEFATSSRDFGRGAAEVARRVRETLVGSDV